MTFHIVTIFPEIFESYFKYGVVHRALKEKYFALQVHDLRDFTSDKHRTVDDTTYGGGAGMLLKVEPIWKCISDIKSKIQRSNSKLNPKSKTQKTKSTRVVLFSAKGKRYTQADARRLSKYDNIIMICGRYEGVDERVAKYVADEEISIGEYILTGGEIPAMIVADSISRIIPGVLGNEESFKGESFYKKGYLEHPQYTKPAVFRNWKVPEVLLEGNHRKIEAWRSEQSSPKKRKKS